MRDKIPIIEIGDCYHCIFRRYPRKCAVTGIDVNYGKIPLGCPLKGGPIQVQLETVNE